MPTQVSVRAEYVSSTDDSLKGHIEIFVVSRTLPHGETDTAYVMHDKLTATKKQANQTVIASTDTLETYDTAEAARARFDAIIATRESKGFLSITVKDLYDA